MSHKLTTEQKEDLMDLLNHPGLPAVHLEIDNMVELIEREVLSFTLEQSNEKELFLRKARAEGAAKLALAIARRFNSLKAKDKK